MKKRILTFIMAGGKGERLFPLTKDRAKPAVPFGGIYRIIDFTLSNCLNSRLTKIFVLTQYKSISLERHLRYGWIPLFHPERREFIQIIPPQQRIGDVWYRGTADAIYQNFYTIERYAVEDRMPDLILILAGDHIYKMNYNHMIDFHLEKGAEITVAGVEVPSSSASEYGIIEVDNSMKIINFFEKPEKPPDISGKKGISFASMGIYLFKTEVLFELLNADSLRDSSHDFGKDIIPDAIRFKKIFAYSFIDENKKTVKYWRDVGSIDSYYDANMDLVAIDPLFNLYDREWPIRTYQEQMPPSKTVHNEPGRRGIAVNSLISNGDIISGGMVERSILSPNVRINSYAHVSESILMEGVEIGRGCKIRRAIIDKGNYIPPSTVIGYDKNEDQKRFFTTEKGIVVIPKEAGIFSSGKSI